MVQDTSIRPVSAALRKKAEEELNETPENINTEVQRLRDWIHEQPHLHTVKPTNQWLVAFLRGSKYDFEKAKKKVDLYYKYKATVPEFFANRDPFDPEIQEILKIGAYLPLRKCGDDEPRTVIANTGAYSATKKPINLYLKVVFMILEILLLEDDNFTIAGENFVADLKDMRFGFLLQWTPSVSKKTIVFFEAALSGRLKSIHCFNPIFGLSTALAIFTMFMKAKIKNRIFVHHEENFSQFHKHVDRSFLPKEYGGTDGNLQQLTDYWKTKVESYRDWFMDETACSDESKRPEKPGFFS